MSSCQGRAALAEDVELEGVVAKQELLDGSLAHEEDGLPLKGVFNMGKN